MEELYSIAPITAEEGIYLIYSNGYFRKFDDSIIEDDKYNVAYIGFIYDRHAFAMALNDLGTYPIVRGSTSVAHDEWGCVEENQLIKNAGSTVPLANGEYIPSYGMMGSVLMHLAQAKSWESHSSTTDAIDINDALDFVGGTRLDLAVHYYTTEEWYALSAYGVFGEYATMQFGYSSYYGGEGWIEIGHQYGRVRPVAKFNYNRNYLLTRGQQNTKIELVFSTMAKKVELCELLGVSLIDSLSGDTVLNRLR